MIQAPLIQICAVGGGIPVVLPAAGGMAGVGVGAAQARGSD